MYSSTQATVTVSINRHLQGGDGSGNYENVNRTSVPNWAPDMQGVLHLQFVDINIHCSLPGSTSCPQSLVAPSDPIVLNETISNPALLSMQGKVDQKVSEGENGNYLNEVGTIITSLNEVIHYNVVWTIDLLNNDIRMAIIFNIEE